MRSISDMDDWYLRDIGVVIDKAINLYENDIEWCTGSDIQMFDGADVQDLALMSIDDLMEKAYFACLRGCLRMAAKMVSQPAGPAIHVVNYNLMYDPSLWEDFGRSWPYPKKDTTFSAVIDWNDFSPWHTKAKEGKNDAVSLLKIISGMVVDDLATREEAK